MLACIPGGINFYTISLNMNKLTFSKFVKRITIWLNVTFFTASITMDERIEFFGAVCTCFVNG